MISLWHEISFREPLWLLLLLQPIILFLILRLLSMLRSSQYSEKHLLPWASAQTQAGRISRFIRPALFLLAWFMLAVAMAGPRLPDSMASQHTTALREVMVLLDMSPSMTARDLQPNRLERVKLELLDLIKRMQGTRMGIIVFGARPHLLSPMTQDKAVLRHYVGTIQSHQLPTLGSRLDLAIDYANKQFANKTDKARALLIISDGEIHADATRQAAITQRIRKLKQQNIRLYALGVGTAYGAPIIAEDQGWLTYQGKSVNSQLHATYLQELSRLGNGGYSSIRDNNLDWQQLYDEGIATLKPINQTIEQEQTIWRELYHGFLIAGVLCLLLGLFQPTHKFNAKLMSWLLLVLISHSASTDGIAAEVNYQTAYASLQAENYQLALKQFSRLAGYAARLGEGSAAYRMENYKHASQQFTQAMLDATNDQQRGHALFNLANCQYQLADYHAASLLYKDVLRYLPGHKGAAINLEYAVALIKQKELETEAEIASRPGRGPATGRLGDGEATQGGRLTLGEDEQDNQYHVPDENIDTSTPNRTLQQARAASRKVDQDTDTDWQYRIDSLEQLQQEHLQVDTNEATLWRRLYEQEEGFIAPVDQAQRLPKEKPW